MGLPLDERREKIIKELGCTKADIDHVLAIDDPKERYINAAMLIYYQIWEKSNKDKSFALSHITCSTLERILGNHDSMKTSEDEVARTIGNLFKEDLESYETDLGFELTNPEILRMIAYERKHKKPLSLNAKQARATWGDCLKFSYNDLIRGIKIPSHIDLATAIYLGIANIGANLFKNKSRIAFFGSEREILLNEQFIRPMHQHLFNINPVDQYNHNDEENTSNENNKKKENVNIYSKVVSTWLRNCMGLSESLLERRILDFRDTKRFPIESGLLPFEPIILNIFLFYGMVARKARLRELANGFRMEINMRRNKPLMKDIEKLSKELFYQVSYNNTQGRLNFGVDTYNQLLYAGSLSQFRFIFENKGAFINPAHIEQINQKIRYS